MNKDITIPIPADVLRRTRQALDDLAIRQQMQAKKTKELADFYHKQYNQAMFPEVDGE